MGLLLLSGGCGAVTMLVLIAAVVGAHRYVQRRAIKPINHVAGMILPCADDPRWIRSTKHARAVFVLDKLVADQLGTGRLRIDDIEIPDSQDYVKAVEQAYCARVAEQALLTS